MIFFFSCTASWLLSSQLLTTWFLVLSVSVSRGLLHTWAITLTILSYSRWQKPQVRLTTHNSSSSRLHLLNANEHNGAATPGLVLAEGQKQKLICIIRKKKNKIKIEYQEKKNGMAESEQLTY